MGNVTMIIGALSLIMSYTHSASSIDRATEFPGRQLRGPTEWLLNRMTRYLSINELYYLYRAAHILVAESDSVRHEIRRKINDYATANHVTLDWALLDDDALQAPPDLRVNTCMALSEFGFIYWHGWDDLYQAIPGAGVPNSLCVVCYKTCPEYEINANAGRLTSIFVLQPGYYEPRIRVNITDDLEADFGGEVGFQFWINGEHHSFQQLDSTTITHLNELRLRNSHFQWFNVRLPIVRVVTPGSNVEWRFRSRGVTGVIFDRSEMWLTSAETAAASDAIVAPVVLSEVFIDPRGDALV